VYRRMDEKVGIEFGLGLGLQPLLIFVEVMDSREN